MQMQHAVFVLQISVTENFNSGVPKVPRGEGIEVDFSKKRVAVVNFRKDAESFRSEDLQSKEILSNLLIAC